MVMTKRQEAQIRKQIESHRHKPYEVDIELAQGFTIKKFFVDEGVFRPDVTCARYVAQWLFFNNGDYYGKHVVDIGSGTGLLGLTTALRGAAYVTARDISHKAFVNTHVNIAGQDLETKMSAEHADLFAAMPPYEYSKKGRYFIFNHPFFPDEPREEEPITVAMLGGKQLIHDFLMQAELVDPAAPIIMSYFHMAGETNNPAVQGPKHNYRARERFRINVKTGLQKGLFSIYELRK